MQNSGPKELKHQSLRCIQDLDDESFSGHGTGWEEEELARRHVEQTIKILRTDCCCLEPTRRPKSATTTSSNEI